MVRPDMTEEQRQRIIRETRSNLQRFQDERSASTSGASYVDARAARSVDGLSSFPSADPPSEPEDDPIKKWAAEGREFQRMLASGRASLRAEEQRHERQGAEFWSAIDARIEAALEVQRQAIFAIMEEGFRGASDLADAVNNKFDDLETKLAHVRTLLAEARERSARDLKQRRAERAGEVVDLPPLSKDLN
jgi:hypothetical protein